MRFEVPGLLDECKTAEAKLLQTIQEKYGELQCKCRLFLSFTLNAFLLNAEMIWNCP